MEKRGGPVSAYLVTHNLGPTQAYTSPAWPRCINPNTLQCRLPRQPWNPLEFRCTWIGFAFVREEKGFRRKTQFSVYPAFFRVFTIQWILLVIRFGGLYSRTAQNLLHNISGTIKVSTWMNAVEFSLKINLKPISYPYCFVDNWPEYIPVWVKMEVYHWQTNSLVF